MSLAERDALLSCLLGQAWPHEPLLDALSLSPSADVLEVGAGQGRLLHFLSRRGHSGRLVGLDPQPGAGVQTGSAEDLPFPTASFDVVLMVRMLMHCTNPARALEEAQRVLRPGGTIVIAVQGKTHLQSLMGGTPARGAEDDVQDILQNSGLTLERQDIRRIISLTLRDAQALLRGYGRSTRLAEADFPLTDTLHLALFKA